MARPTAGAPIPLSLGLGYVSRSRLPSFHAFRSASVPLHSMRSTAHLELSADACAPHLAALVTTLALSAFDTELLAAAPGALASHATRRHAALRILRPSSTTFPPRLPTRVSHTSRSPISPGIAAALAPSRPLRPMMPRIANTLYDSLHPAALFGALIGALKGLILVLTPDVGVRAHGPLLGALGNSGAGLETPELSFKGISDEVSLKAPYKQVGPLLPNSQSEAAQAEEGPSRLAL
ncbi:hypothetical protein EDB86DRAFT_3167489 [Lactarius hatsudake]|nr:hypothetical protein EDB86DRAFT_3167489 [Lactarius hatsudake]